MKVKKTLLLAMSRVLAITAVTALASVTQAAVIFDHDFGNALVSGAAVTTTADLGIPAAGSFSFSDQPVGGISGGASGANVALAVVHRTNPIANITNMATSSVAFGPTYPDTQVADAGNGDAVYADFASVGEFTGGSSTEISFNMATFGNSNTGAFKYAFVRGLDALDNEVFELLLIAGSGSGTRQVYARAANDDSTTLTAAGSGTPEGQLLANTFTNGNNSTNIAAGPFSMYAFDILLEDGMVTYDIGTTGGSVNLSAVNGTALPINSSATSISRLEFSAFWNASVDGQNKGYWVDNILAETTIIPEPTSAFLLLASFAGVALVRKRNEV